MKVEGRKEKVCEEYRREGKQSANLEVELEID
jgi:hypothetical protein